MAPSGLLHVLAKATSSAAQACQHMNCGLLLPRTPVGKERNLLEEPLLLPSSTLLCDESTSVPDKAASRHEDSPLHADAISASTVDKGTECAPRTPTHDGEIPPFTPWAEDEDCACSETDAVRSPVLAMCDNREPSLSASALSGASHCHGIELSAQQRNALASAGPQDAEGAWFKLIERLCAQHGLAKVQLGQLVLDEERGPCQGGFGSVRFAQWNSTLHAVKVGLQPQQVLEEVGKAMLASGGPLAARGTITPVLPPTALVYYGSLLTGFMSPACAISLDGYLCARQRQCEARGQQGLDVDEVMWLAWWVAAGVAMVEQAGMVHMDLKSRNVMLTLDVEGARRSGHRFPIYPRLIDFGGAHLLDWQGKLVHTGPLMYTPWYTAPEVLRGHRRLVGTTSDMPALGCLLAEVVASGYRLAHLQWEQEHVAHVLHTRGTVGVQVPAAPHHPPAWRNDWQALVDWCCMLDPDVRPCCGEVMDRIRDIAQWHGVEFFGADY